MIILQDSIEGVTPDHLHGFFEGWPNPPDRDTDLRVLSGSDVVVLAIDDHSANVVGFITAITDGVLAAFIPNLEVLPEYRGQGIGQRLVDRVRERLSDLYSIDLVCDASVQPFYEKLGFHRTQGMFIRNYANQSGRRE